MNGKFNSNSFFSNDVKGSFLSQFSNRELLQKKIIAFSKHLLLSSLIISSFLLFAIYQWFPNSSLELTGIKDVLILIVIADIVIGPLLTFLVFNPAKKSLKFDLISIVALQLCMFIYGTYTVYNAHPVYITFTVDRFSLVSARDADPSKTNINEYQTSKLSKPIYAYVESPKSSEEKNNLLFSSIHGGLDLDALPQYYLPYIENNKKILNSAWQSENIFKTNQQKSLLKSFLNDNDTTMDEIVFIPVQGKAKYMTYVLDKKTVKPIAVFDIDPWENKS